MAPVEQILTDLKLPDTTWRQPCLIATFGFPGAGKTAVAATIGERLPLVCLTTDLIRLRYGFASGPETLAAMCSVAGALFSQNYSVIFDGIHMLRKNRQALREFGKANQAEVRFVHVCAWPDVIKQRLNDRLANPEATYQQGKFVITDAHFQRIIHYFEAPSGEPDVVEVDTSSASVSTSDQLHSLYAELVVWLKAA